jgi:hypothetical protein
VSLSAEIEIVVRPAAESSQPPVAEPTSQPEATDPPFRPTPRPPPDGSPVDVDSDGTFQLRLDPSSSVYRADEPIVLNASYAYLGPDSNVVAGHFAPGVSLFVEELGEDGDMVGNVQRYMTYDSACSELSLRSGSAVPIRIADGNLMGLRATALPDGFSADLDDGVLRLLPGRYRVRASLSMYLGGCRDGQPDDALGHGLSVVVEVVVVPLSWSRLEIQTATAASAICLLMAGHGVVAPNATSGIGFVDAEGSLQAVTWPFGWSGWRDGDGVILMDEQGRLAARERDRVSWGGGPSTVCSDFENLGP